MSNDPDAYNQRRSSASIVSERTRSDGRKMSARDIDEQIEAGFRKEFEGGSSNGLEVSQGNNGAAPAARKAPRRPLNGTPPTTTPELE